MYPNSAGRRSSTNPSQIPTSRNSRSRVRNSSSDRASGRISYLKPPGKTSLYPQTPVTPARASIKINVPSSAASSSGRHHGLSIGRSHSADRANNMATKGPKKDTRPLVDKSYQATLLSKIDRFFYENQCSGMLNTNGSLKPITLKMFVEVSSYLLNFFEIKQDLTMTNYIEELPYIAKKLRYPGVITKAWLKTANAMHSWPQVLGWIGWLVEACQVQQLACNRYQIETLPFVGTEQEALNSKKEFLMLLECYTVWNDEKLDEEDELLQKYLRDVETEWGASEENVAQAKREVEEETRKLQIIEEDSMKVDEEVERLQHMLSSLHAKETKQLNDITAKERYTKKLTSETAQMNAEQKTLNEQIQQVNKQHKELISTVKEQPISKVEKEEIVKKCTEIQNYIHGFDEHLKDYQKELYSLDIKLASINNNLNKLVLAYNKEIFMFVDNDIGVNFNELKLPEKGLLDPRIIEILEEKITLMKNLKESLKSQCNDVTLLIQSDTMELESLQEKIESSLDDEKLQDLKSQVDKIKTDARREKAKLMEQIEALRNEIKEVEASMPDVRAMQFEVEEAEDKLNAVVRRMMFLKESGEQFFEELYQIIGEHRSVLAVLLKK